MRDVIEKYESRGVQRFCVFLCKFQPRCLNRPVRRTAYFRQRFKMLPQSAGLFLVTRSRKLNFSPNIYIRGKSSQQYHQSTEFCHPIQPRFLIFDVRDSISDNFPYRFGGNIRGTDISAPYIRTHGLNASGGYEFAILAWNFERFFEKSGAARL